MKAEQVLLTISICKSRCRIWNLTHPCIPLCGIQMANGLTLLLAGSCNVISPLKPCRPMPSPVCVGYKRASTCLNIYIYTVSYLTLVCHTANPWLLLWEVNHLPLHVAGSLLSSLSLFWSTWFILIGHLFKGQLDAALFMKTKFSRTVSLALIACIWTTVCHLLSSFVFHQQPRQFHLCIDWLSCIVSKGMCQTMQSK